MGKTKENAINYDEWVNMEYYYPCHNSIMGLYNPTMAVIFGIILRLALKEGYSTASTKAIALRAGVSSSTTKRWIQKLKTEGLIVDVTPTDKVWQKKHRGTRKQVRYYKPIKERHAEMIVEWKKSPKNPDNAFKSVLDLESEPDLESMSSFAWETKVDNSNQA